MLLDQKKRDKCGDANETDAVSHQNTHRHAMLVMPSTCFFTGRRIFCLFAFTSVSMTFPASTDCHSLYQFYQSSKTTSHYMRQTVLTSSLDAFHSRLVSHLHSITLFNYLFCSTCLPPHLLKKHRRIRDQIIV